MRKNCFIFWPFESWSSILKNKVSKKTNIFNYYLKILLRFHWISKTFLLIVNNDNFKYYFVKIINILKKKICISKNVMSINKQLYRFPWSKISTISYKETHCVRMKENTILIVSSTFIYNWYFLQIHHLFECL